MRGALRRLMAGRTVIVIAHRLSTIRDADEIVLVNNGRVAEHGTHEQLLQCGGMYMRFIEAEQGKSKGKPLH